MDTGGLPDMYMRGTRATDPRAGVNMSGRPLVPMLQILSNTFTPKIKGIYSVTYLISP